jgi:hypothetical protein
MWNGTADILNASPAIRPAPSHWNGQVAMTMATNALGIDAPCHDAEHDNARFLDELRTSRRASPCADESGTHAPLPYGLPIRNGAGAGRRSARQPRRAVESAEGLRRGEQDHHHAGRQYRPHGRPGATLFQLENALKPLGRDPHSVIGSSCIGASVFGGVCNNSGGARIHRGPAFTQMALFACIDDAGDVQLINHLGVRLGNDPETILGRLDRDAFTEVDIEYTPDRVASDHDYAQHVRDIDADTPGRFNADPKRLFEASGSAGKVMIFAVRLDTFPKEGETKVFYVGTNDPAELTKIRRHILAHFKDLPIEGEYLHRVAFDIAEKYGKDTFLAIRYLGTAWLPTLFAIKGSFDAFAGRVRFFPRDLSDKIMQAIGRLVVSDAGPVRASGQRGMGSQNDGRARL